MRPIGLHGCPENFRVSLTTPTATIANIFHGLLFGSTMNVPTKFEVRVDTMTRVVEARHSHVTVSVPEIIGGTQKI